MSIDRVKLRAKFGGRCAYCGKPLEKIFHADHVEPICRTWTEGALASQGRTKGEDSEDNLFPSCPRCNRWKSMMTIEEFRIEIYAQNERVRRYSAEYRLAEDFGLVRATGQNVVFYFEKHPVGLRTGLDDGPELPRSVIRALACGRARA